MCQYITTHKGKWLKCVFSNSTLCSHKAFSRLLIYFHNSSLVLSKVRPSFPDIRQCRDSSIFVKVKVDAKHLVQLRTSEIFSRRVPFYLSVIEPSREAGCGIWLGAGHAQRRGDTALGREVRQKNGLSKARSCRRGLRRWPQLNKNGPKIWFANLGTYPQPRSQRTGLNHRFR